MNGHKHARTNVHMTQIDEIQTRETTEYGDKWCEAKSNLLCCYYRCRKCLAEAEIVDLERWI